MDKCPNDAQIAQNPEPDLAASSLPERLRSSDLESVNKPLTGLFADLRSASRPYAEKDFSDREATIVALDATWRFLMQFRVTLDELLHLPPLNLSAALLALNNNNVTPILKPTATLKGGSAFDSVDRQVLIGVAVGTVGRLRWTGMSVLKAYRLVATGLVMLGIKPARGAGPITARTVKEWCQRLSANRPAIRSILAGGTAALAEAEPSDIAPMSAVVQADEMLSPKWQSLIERQPRDAARVFVVDSLRAAIQAKVAGGNTPRFGKKAN
jgi:hypothetical protein